MEKLTKEQLTEIKYYLSLLERNLVECESKNRNENTAIIINDLFSLCRDIQSIRKIKSLVNAIDWLKDTSWMDLISSEDVIMVQLLKITAAATWDGIMKVIFPEDPESVCPPAVRKIVIRKNA